MATGKRVEAGWFWLAAGAVLVIAHAVRLYRLLHWPLGGDEGWDIGVGALSLPQITLVSGK